MVPMNTHKIQGNNKKKLMINFYDFADTFPDAIEWNGPKLNSAPK
jgi:hypothetical protein